MTGGLSSTERASLENALNGLSRSLREAVDASRAAAGPVDLDQPIGRVSRVDAIQQQKMVEAGREAARARLGQVEAALRRIEDGEYGDCLACGESIGSRRLSARPEAPLCLECQERRETPR